ncbi:MAG TPA: diadenylate cyclase [Longimicrobiales bacterium]|nr:diadenylate cyclase [Longimicrobiales bacterium]
MQNRNRALLDGAVLISREIGANAILLAAALPREARYLRRAVGSACRVITATGAPGGASGVERDVLSLPEVRLRRRGRAKIALLEALAAGMLRDGDRVIILSGDVSNGCCELDTLAVVELTGGNDSLDGQPGAAMDSLRHGVDPAAFDALLGLCVELGHESKAGRRPGLLATLGDHEAVLARSHPIVLNPFEGHPEAARSILTAAAKRAVREFAGIDGAFVLRGDGVIAAAGRYLEPMAPVGAVPSGLGTRHRAAAGITRATRCVAFVVSESTGDTRVFSGGRVLTTIERTD